MTLNPAFHSCAAVLSLRSTPTPLMWLGEEVLNQEISQGSKSNELRPREAIVKQAEQMAALDEQD